MLSTVTVLAITDRANQYTHVGAPWRTALWSSYYQFTLHSSVSDTRQFSPPSVIPPRVFLFNTRGAFGVGGNPFLVLPSSIEQRIPKMLVSARR